MSDGHEHDAHDSAADAHDDHGFDGEPAKELGPDEPMTPGWLPALGGALFACLALAGIMMSRDGLDAANGAAAGSGAVRPPAGEQKIAQPAEQAPRPAALPTRPQMLQPGKDAPDAAKPSLKHLSPEDSKDLQEKLKKAMEQRKNAQPPAPGGQ
ncbi:MAG: hypothetical protein U0441_29480 [Polyangiaceae bacterium]